jgi:nucleoside-diphosphate-sugar epimerase
MNYSNNISVFGASGFIGFNFCKLYKNINIIKKESNIPTSSEVLYFISTVDNYNIYTDPYLDINTNLIKLVSVLEECKKLKNEGKQITFNFISSWFVYGKTDQVPATETALCNPTGFYSITKHAAEKMLISYCETFGLNYRILRLTSIIGPGDKKVSTKKNAMQHLITCLKTGEPIKIYDNGSNIRDFMDVVDCCKAIKCCIDNAPVNEIINISNAEPITIGEVLFYANDKLQSTTSIESIETPEFHKVVQIKNMWLDNKKLLSYGYIPETSVFESVDKILEKL